ncbi:DUF1127 domain-containing protein [Pseudaeromonas paramecii]|uniref:DUF1127 domain-containing protein n=1 Tax=Pseudaeromonas paramecii TaxID=2138166 RepID=A0ABP8PTJ6_9GAMM
MATHTASHLATASHTSLLSLFMTWYERARSRRELAELPPYLLRDIGLTEGDRYSETHKPFWRE